MEHRGRKSKIANVGKKVNGLVKQGYSFQEVANMLGLGSRQAARYHFGRYRGMTSKSKGRR